MELETEVIDPPAEAPPAAPAPAQNLDEATNRALERLGDKFGDKPETPAPVEKPAAAPSDKKGTDKPLGELDEKTLADLREGKIIPKHRLDEVLQRQKLYDAFGSPEELVTRLRTLEEAVKNGSQPAKPADAPKTDEEIKAEEDSKKDRDYILKIFPELKNVLEKHGDLAKAIGDIKAKEDAMQAADEGKYNSFIKSAEDEVVKLAKEQLGVNVDDPLTSRLVQVAIAEILENDQKLFERFYRDQDPKAIKEAFDQYLQKFASGIQRTASAKLLQGKKGEASLPKPPAKAGSAPITPEAPRPRTLDEAGDSGWDRITQG